MSPRQMRIYWSAGLATAALLLVAGAFLRIWKWGLFDLFSFEPPFADTVAILAAGEARQAGLDVYQPLPADPLGRPHVYGPGWLATGMLGLTTRDAGWIGVGLIVVFVVTAAAVLGPRRLLDAVFALLLLCSPPIMLAFNRGNNDLVIGLLLSGGAWLLTRPDAWPALGGRGLIAAAALLKLYPFAALPALVLRERSWQRAVLWLGLTGLLCLAVLGWWRADYVQALQLAPSPRTALAYGLPVTVLCWEGLPAFRSLFIGGWLAGLAVGGALLVPRAKKLWVSVPADGFSANIFVAGALSWAFCFLSIRNFPYRLLLLLLPARVWFEHRESKDDDNTGLIQILLWIGVAWLDVPKRIWTVKAEHDLLVTGPSWSIFSVIIGIEQSLIAVLTLCLLVSVTGAFVRHARAWGGASCPIL